MAYFPSVANKLAWPALGVGGLLFTLASRGLLRKPVNDSSA